MESTGTEQPTVPPQKPSTDAPAEADTIAHPPSSGDHSAIETPNSALATVRYFGDYELLEEIARGGMGVVYKARQ